MSSTEAIALAFIPSEDDGALILHAKVDGKWVPVPVVERKASQETELFKLAVEDATRKLTDCFPGKDFDNESSRSKTAVAVAAAFGRLGVPTHV